MYHSLSYIHYILSSFSKVEFTDVNGVNEGAYVIGYKN